MNKNKIKNVLITGSGKRIGAEIARSFAANQWNIGIHYNNSVKEAKKLSIEIEKKYNTKTCLIKADLSDLNQLNKIIPYLDKLIQGIEQEFNTNPSIDIPVVLVGKIREEGEQGIISYLSTLKMEAISTDLILLLDALRSALKFSDNLNDPVLIRIFDNCRENEYTE